LRGPLAGEFDGMAVSINENKYMRFFRFACIGSVLVLLSMIGFRRCMAVLKGEMLQLSGHLHLRAAVGPR
jgi:hypothetical protein